MMWKSIKPYILIGVVWFIALVLLSLIWGCIKYVEIPVPDNQWQKFIASRGHPPNVLAIFIGEKIAGAYVIFYKESCIDDRLIKAHERSHGVEKENGWPSHSIYPDHVHTNEITAEGCSSVKTTTK